jgi:hypothetical protein
MESASSLTMSSPSRSNNGGEYGSLLGSLIH